MLLSPELPHLGSKDKTQNVTDENTPEQAHIILSQDNMKSEHDKNVYDKAYDKKYIHIWLQKNKKKLVHLDIFS